MFIGEGRIAGNDRPHPENRDAWGTLYTNALALRRGLDELIALMSKEFG